VACQRDSFCWRQNVIFIFLNNWTTEANLNVKRLGVFSDCLLFIFPAGKKSTRLRRSMWFRECSGKSMSEFKWGHRLGNVWRLRTPFCIHGMRRQLILNTRLSSRLWPGYVMYWNFVTSLVYHACGHEFESRQKWKCSNFPHHLWLLLSKLSFYRGTAKCMVRSPLSSGGPL